MRWKYFIPALAFVVICTVFCIFFLDSILKFAFVSGGEMAFGAKVEISSVKTKLSNLSINVSGIKVANSADVFKNLFEVDSIRFALKPVPLLSKKIIIDEMTVDGLRWGTKRDTSGALPPKKVKKIAKKEAKENKNSPLSKLFTGVKDKAVSKASALPAANQLKDMQKQLSGFSLNKTLSANDLESVKEMDNLRTSYTQKYTQYQSQLGSININQEIEKGNSAINDIKSIKIQSVQDIEPAKAKLDTFNSTKDELSKTASEIQTMGSKMSSDFGGQNDLINKINELKDRDYKSLSDKLKLPSFSFGNISEAIFGPVWLTRVHTVLYYMNTARKYMPPKKKNQKTVNTRLKGSDISFPLESNPPDFLIAKVLISGTTGGYGKEGEALDFKGTITDITSDQAQLGRPTRMEINGVQGSRKLAVTGVLDHRTDNPVDTINMVFSGLTAENLGLPESDYLPDMAGSTGAMTANFVLKGDNIESNMELKISNFKTTSNTADETRKMILSLWSGISEIIVNAKLTGTFENFVFSVSSNIDKVLSERFKNMLGAKFQDIQNQLRAQIDQLTNGKKNELLGDFNSKKDGLTKQFADKQKEAQSKSDEVKSQMDAKQNEGKGLADKEKKAAQDKIDAEKRAAQEKADAEKKAAEDAAKKQAEDKLQQFNPFK